MSKLNKFTKKIVTMILVISMIILSLPINPITAMATQDITDIGENSAEFGAVPGTFAETGHAIHYANYDGKTYVTFCIEWGVPSPKARVYDKNEFKAYKNKNQALLREIAKYIYFGYTMWYGDGIPYDIESTRAYCCTQQYVWELMGVDAPRTKWKSNYFNDDLFNAWKAKTDQYIDLWYNRSASFHNSTITLKYGESKNITDNNGTLQYYPAFEQTVNGIKYKHLSNSNNLEITATNNVNTHNHSFNSGDYNIKMSIMPNGSQCNSSYSFISFEFSDTNIQDLMFSRYVDPSWFSINVNVEYGDIELTKQDLYGAKIDGTQFGLYTDKACTNKIATTTSNKGIVKFNKLVPKTYYVKELKASNGFILSNNVTTVNVTNNNTSKTTLTNKEPTAKITLTKNLDTSKTNGKYGDVTISEAEYTLYAKNKITSKLNSHTFYEKDAVVSKKKITVGNNGTVGTVTWDKLPLGSYYIKETSNPVGTFIDNNSYSVTLSYKDENTSVITNNNSKSTDVVKCQRAKIFKAGTDGNSGLLTGLEGAEFTIKLYSDVQKALQDGYSYDEIWNDDNNSIAPTYSKVITDSDGYALTDYLPYGQYIAKETSTPIDYEPCADFTFSIDKDESEYPIHFQTKDLNVNNAPFKSFVKIVKKDKESGKDVTLSSATFKIRAKEDIKDNTTGEVLFKNGDFITYKVGNNKYNEFMTNSDGYITVDTGNTYATKNDEKGSVMTPFKLQAGAYEIVEIKEPNGFLISDNSYPFVVTTVLGYDTDVDGDPVISIVATNEQPKGEIIINKDFILRENIDKSLIDNIDFTKVGFSLTAATDIIDMSDGTILYNEGEEIGEYYLNDDATVVIDDLWIGNYILKETSTIEGGVLDETEYPISFEVKDNTTKKYTQTIDIHNNTTEADCIKSDITGNVFLEGAELVVTDEEGNEIDKWISTNDSHKIEGLVVGHTYSLTENYAPNGFVIANTINFTISNTKEIQNIVMLDKSILIDKQYIDNSRIKGTELTVTNILGDEIDKWIVGQHIINITDDIKNEIEENGTATNIDEVNNVQYIISLDKDTENYFITKISDDTIEYFLTDTEGNEVSHMCRGLEENQSYILSETKTVEGYITAKSIEFEVTPDKENQSIVMIDKKAFISKTEITGDKELEGAKLKVEDEDGNIVDEWISGKTPHNVIGLVEGMKYILTEEIAPNNYVIASKIEFTIDDIKEDQFIKMVDKQVTASKVDITNNEELEGAELVVTDEEGNEIDKWTSTKDTHYINGLIEGHSYTLTEITAPYGFKIAESIKFEVTSDKENQSVVMKDVPILSSVRVIKCDITTKKAIVSNEFEFSIFADKDCKELISTSGANMDEGTALFKDLRYGTYYIAETKAPIGYSLSDQVVEVVINDKGVFADGVNLEEINGIYSFEYYDELLPVIKTGDKIINKKLIVMGVLLIIFITLFIFINKIINKKTPKIKEGGNRE